jgi:hypothetical protein
MTVITPDAVTKVAMGFMAAKHLFVASEIGLFDADKSNGHHRVGDDAKRAYRNAGLLR